MPDSNDIENIKINADSDKPVFPDTWMGHQHQREYSHDKDDKERVVVADLDPSYLVLAVCVLVCVIVLLIVAILGILYRNYQHQSSAEDCHKTAQPQPSHPLYYPYYEVTTHPSRYYRDTPVCA